MCAIGLAKLNPNLRSFWKTKADLKILKGGRSSSKTWDTAGIAVLLAARYKVKYLCVRQFQNRIQDSVYAILKDQIERFGLKNEFEVLANSITHRRTGSSFHFYGIQRNLAEIKGFEGADILWIEEAEALTKDQWSVIEPTLRKEGSEAWILYNPRFVNDFVETFRHDPEGGVIVRHINYDENPFLSETMLRKIRRLKENDYDQYEHDYLGVPYSDDDNVIIKRSWVEAAIDAHIALGIPLGKSRVAGFDIADSGKDLCSLTEMEGIVCTHLESWRGKEDELLQSCTRVWRRAIDGGYHVNYDSIGVGAGAGAKFQELNDARKAEGLHGVVEYSKFIAGAGIVNPDECYIETEGDTVTNKEFFYNLKTQAWWLVADRFRNTYNAVRNGEVFEPHELISISGNLENISNLVTELSTPRRKFNKNGKVQVESKDELSKRGVDSPNDADSFIMANAPSETDTLGNLLRMALN